MHVAFRNYSLLLRGLLKQLALLNSRYLFGFVPQLIGNNLLNDLLAIISADRDPVRLDINFVAFNAFYFVNGNDIGFMHPDK